MESVVIKLSVSFHTNSKRKAKSFYQNSHGKKNAFIKTQADRQVGSNTFGRKMTQPIQ